VTAAPDKPTVLSLKPGHIPDELCSIDAWVGWRLVWVKETRRWTKQPVNLKTGGLAKSDDSSTWV
jgi:primase-polymerase (primpol)-like protein